jgi:hypothetical protein
MGHSAADAAPLRGSRVVEAISIYYGYVILDAACVAFAMTLPAQTVGVSLFIDSIVSDLAVSRSVVSLLYTVAKATAVICFAIAAVALVRGKAGD